MNYPSRHLSSLFIVLCLILISGCKKKEEGLGRYGLMDENTPD